MICFFTIVVVVAVTVAVAIVVVVVVAAIVAIWANIRLEIVSDGVFSNCCRKGVLKKLNNKKS